MTEKIEIVYTYSSDRYDNLLKEYGGLDMFEKLMKDKKKLVLLLLVIAILIVVLVFVIMNLSASGKDTNKFKKEYEKLNNVATEDGKKYPYVSIPADNKMKYVDYEGVLAIFNNMEDEVIYLGNAECLYCRSAVQVLVNTAVASEIDEIYYLDTSKKSDKYEELMEVLGDNFVEEKDGEKKIYEPLVIFVVDGKVVSYNKGTLFSQGSPYTELDKSQIEGLGGIYESGINDVLDAKKIG